MFTSSIRFLLAFSLCIMLAACNGNDVRHSLGMERNQPDEFQVVSRPPLSVPPVYYLRPPAEDETVQTAPASDQAKSLVLKGQELPPSVPGASDPNYHNVQTAVTPVGESSLETTGDESFLRKAKTDSAQKDIRKTLNDENRPIIAEEKREKGFLEKLHLKDDSEPVVDAKKEQERILINKEEGKPANDGEVQVIDSKKDSTIDKIFK